MIIVEQCDWLVRRRDTFPARGKEQARVWHVIGNIPLTAAPYMFQSELLNALHLTIIVSKQFLNMPLKHEEMLTRNK